VVYVSKGPEYAEKLYKGQQVTLTRDYQQLGDWIAHGNYPIGLAAGYEYVAPFKDTVKIEEFNLPDVREATAGGFGMLGLWNQAPHPAAAKVFVNWLASKEGTTVYARSQNTVAVRTDVDSSGWAPASNVPKKGVEYLDTYAYEFVTETRQKIAKFYSAMLG
jgi:ABC-type glycerol-3-phosphate transport system substrate-binding protein